MATEEQKAENRRVFRSRHESRKYTRTTHASMQVMRCTSCGTRPYIKLTDYREDNHHECVMLACECNGKFKWFEVVPEEK